MSSIKDVIEKLAYQCEPNATNANRKFIERMMTRVAVEAARHALGMSNAGCGRDCDGFDEEDILKAVMGEKS